MNKFNKKQKVIIIIIIGIILIIAIYFYYNSDIKLINGNTSRDLATFVEENNNTQEKQTQDLNSDPEEKNSNNNKEDIKSEEEIVIHITGAIKNEGVYRLKKESRISNAVEAAGGLTENADTSKINLAYVLEDGMKIVIPSINDSETCEELISTGIGGDSDIIDNNMENKKSEKININTADAETLDKLPGIGEATANKIIDYRNDNGKFKSIEEIKNVKGIGESKYEEIKDWICV